MVNLSQNILTTDEQCSIRCVPPVARTRVHVLTDILIIGILSVIAGGNGWEDMENYGVSKGEWLEQFLALPGGIPSADTFRLVE